MRDRPVYLTLALVFVIVYNTWRLKNSFLYLNTWGVQLHFQYTLLPTPMLDVQYILNFAVPLVCAAFMWGGANWARVLYLGYGIISYLLLTACDPNKFHYRWEILFFACVAPCLLLPGARSYFLLKDHYT